jgi:hypothetical protein
MRALLAAALIVLTAPSLLAAERAGRPIAAEPPPVVAVPWSPHRIPQAQAVAASRECWRGCQMSCKADFLACGYQQSGAECLALTDRCDRACQRRCRNTGDPIIDWPRLWD